MGKRFLKGDFDISQAGEKLGLIVGGIILLALIATMCATTGKAEKCGAGTVECDESVSSCGCCDASVLRDTGRAVSLCSCPTGYTWDNSIGDCCRNIEGGRECINTGRVCTSSTCPAENENCPDSGCCARGVWNEGEGCCVENGACVCPPARSCDESVGACREWGGCCGEGLNWDAGRACCVNPSSGACVTACPDCLTWSNGACRDASGNAFECALGIICSADGSACCRDACGGCEQECAAGTTWDCRANGGAGCCIDSAGVCHGNVETEACVAEGRGCSGSSGGCVRGCCPPGFSWGASGSVQCCQSGGICSDDRVGGRNPPERICEPNPCEYDLNTDRKLNPDDVNLWLEKCFVEEVVEVTETRTDAEGNPVEVVLVQGVPAHYITDGPIDECDYDVEPYAGSVSGFDERCVRDICKGEEEGWECTILSCLE